MSMLPAVLHNKLVEAGQYSIDCRGMSSRVTAKHREALEDLQVTIDEVISTAPYAFREEALEEMYARRRNRG